MLTKACPLGRLVMSADTETESNQIEGDQISTILDRVVGRMSARF